ncbi:monooxygenase [Thraustotheca clavata]|uniref:Monooxygenase n=1 Tax=Thraustotheca clavata TaxID=74557 RepID=A0A1W0A7Z3_9STRA|nr:monooxygenase [Thraustotheca clavata]
MSGPIRVMTERIMSRGFEPTVCRLMEQMRTSVSKQPGLISVETLGDLQDFHHQVTISQWRSQKEYKAWVDSPEYKNITTKLNEVLDQPDCKTRIFQAPREDVFLL